MPQVSASITIAGQSASDLLPSILEMEVEEDHDTASVVRIKLAIYKPESGLWAFLDDDRIKLWATMVVSASIADDAQDLFTGYVTEIKAHFDIEDNSSYIVIHAMDGTCLMAVQDRFKGWPNQTDSDVASQILSGYGFTPQVADSGVVHDTTIATINQHETDYHFLKRLARRNGFEFGVTGSTAYFSKPTLNSTPLPVLAVQFGGDTNVASVDTRVNALQPALVEMHQIDTIGKQAQDSEIKKSGQTQLGQASVLTLNIPHGVTSRVIVKHAVATGVAEMQNLCQAVYDRAEWLMEARGQVDSVAYGAFLRSRSLVPMKGTGQMFSGMYYLTNVRHVFTVSGYIQHFTARRNALMPKDSDFVSTDSLF